MHKFLEAFIWYIGLGGAILTFIDPDNTLAQLPFILLHSNMHKHLDVEVFLINSVFELHWNRKLHILSIQFITYQH